MFCVITSSVARQKAFFCAALLPSTAATCSREGRGSSRPSTQLLPRRVTVAAAAARWALGAQALGHTEGSVKTVSHAVKKWSSCISIVNPATFLPNSLKTTLLASVLPRLLSVIKIGDPGARRALTSVLTDTHAPPPSHLIMSTYELGYSLHKM